MKKLFIFIVTVLSILTLSSFSSNDYDYIEEYKIVVNPNDDGTLNISYSLKWNALRDGSEDYIKIGIPNRHAKIEGFNNKDIKKASIDGSYVRLDLYHSFSSGDKYNLEFTINQDYMFSVGEDNGNKYINYEFIPGWFDEIEVGSLKVYWNSAGVVEADSSSRAIDNYYVWSYSLAKGERISCRLYYNMDYFPNINIDRGLKNDPDKLLVTLFITGLIIFVVGLVVIAIIENKLKNENSYYTARGFVPYYSHSYFLYHPHGVDKEGNAYIKPINTSTGGSRGSSVSGCACACACACAGGGRAGCSRKDFYKPKLKLDDLKDSINK